ncbi:hypothetical protein [Plantactinospora sp. WMMB782]|uniref:hypothetical protein n=1 Tax=Plantactinospora sp. WMMB782 TaxID=3404121 RepID=UPI003B93A28F
MPDLDPYDPDQSHDDPAVQILIHEGWLGVWDHPIGVTDLENGVRQVRTADIVNGRTESLVALAEWLVMLDDPEGPGAVARRSVTMNQIIQRARVALDRKS